MLQTAINGKTPNGSGGNRYLGAGRRYLTRSISDCDLSKVIILCNELLAIQTGKLIFPLYQIAIGESGGLFSPAIVPQPVGSSGGWRGI
jgi:hypothetical protein